jgi:hypothetical protein
MQMNNNEGGKWYTVTWSKCQQYENIGPQFDAQNSPDLMKQWSSTTFCRLSRATSKTNLTYFQHKLLTLPCKGFKSYSAKVRSSALSKNKVALKTSSIRSLHQITQSTALI